MGELAPRFQLVPADKRPGEIDLLMPARGAEPLWSGPADAGRVKEMAWSPARSEIAKAILRGNSAVWVVVQGAAAAVNEAFESRLRGRLKYLETVAAIPEQDPFDPESRLGPGPALRVGFDVVVVERKDPGEELLRRMMVGPKGAEYLADGTPFAGAVFGRGRMLGPFTAEQLDEAGIDEICLYLLGACSCQVKAQNPGWDLLMDTDWDTELMKVAMAETASVSNPSAQAATPARSAEPELVVIGESSLHRPNPPARELVLGLGLLALLLIWLGWKNAS